MFPLICKCHDNDSCCLTCITLNQEKKSKPRLSLPLINSSIPHQFFILLPLLSILNSKKANGSYAHILRLYLNSKSSTIINHVRANSYLKRRSSPNKIFFLQFTRLDLMNKDNQLSRWHFEPIQIFDQKPNKIDLVYISSQSSSTRCKS